MNKKLVFLAAFLLLLLSGCGIVAIGYNYANVYLRYSINSYASFNEEQKEAISDDVNKYMLWHRNIMLPEYVSFLQGLQRAVQSGTALKKEDVAKFRVQVRALYVKTLQPAVIPSAILLSGISPAQIDELVISFAKENDKQKAKELSGSASEQLRKRAERSIDFIESLVGGFSDKQLEQIRDMSYRLPFATSIYIRQREDNQAGLIELLRNKKSAKEIEAYLFAWLIKPEASRSQDEQDIMAAFENASDEMIANVHQILSERQKKTFLKNIIKYINIFQDIASKS